MPDEDLNPENVQPRAKCRNFASVCSHHSVIQSHDLCALMIPEIIFKFLTV